MLVYVQIILNLYRIVAKILWNRTPQAIISSTGYEEQIPCKVFVYSRF